METRDGVGSEKRRPGNIRHAERWELSLGMGALLAFWLLVFGRLERLLDGTAADQWASFVGAATMGMLACALAVGLLCVKDPYRAVSLRTASPPLFASLAGVAIALMAVGYGAWAILPLAVPVSGGGAPESLVLSCGAATGIGFCLLSLLYFEKLGRRPTCDCAGSVAAALMWFALCSLVLLVCPREAAGAYGVALVAVAAGGLVRREASDADASPAAPNDGPREAPASPHDGRDDAPGTLPARLGSLARSSWRMFAVVLVCALMLGFNWDPRLLGLVEISHATALVQEVVGALVAAAVLWPLRCMASGAEALMRLQRTVIPVVVATFVVVPYFPLESTGAAFYEFVGFVRAASILIFGGGFVLALSASARIADVSLLFAGALAGVLGALCLVAGHAVAVTFGVQASPLVVLLFVAYLVATVAASSLGHGEEQRAREIERSVFDAYLQKRCADIAAEKGLSPRESEMLVYLSRGHGYVYIAELAFVSESTVRAHAKSIFKKCGVSSREELLDYVDQVRLP